MVQTCSGLTSRPCRDKLQGDWLQRIVFLSPGNHKLRPVQFHPSWFKQALNSLSDVCSIFFEVLRELVFGKTSASQKQAPRTFRKNFAAMESGATVVSSTQGIRN